MALHPTSSFEEIRQDVLAAAYAVSYAVPADGDSDLDQSLAMERANMDEERAVDRLTKGVYAWSLWRLMPGLAALHARCLAEGRQDASTGLDLGNGAVAFAVPLAKDGVRLVAVETEEHRFATALVATEGGEKLVVGPYLPTAEPFLATLPAPLPKATRDIVALAEQRQHYAGEFRPGLIEVAQGLAKNGRMPYGADGFALTVRHPPGGRINTYIAVDRVWIGHWAPYAKMMAPVVTMASASPADPWCANDHDSVLAEAALALDNGFYGSHCSALDRELRDQLLINRAHATAYKFGHIHDTLVAHGFVWGKKRLRFGDLDEAAFVVPTNVPGRAAIVREHGSSRTLVMLQRSADGTVERIEALPLFQPLGWLMENWYKPSIECLNDLARLVGRAANPDANPPRLTQAEAAHRLATGGALPSPVIGIDLVAGCALPGSAVDGAIGKYLFFEADLAYRALADLKPGAKKQYGCEASKRFGDEDWADQPDDDLEIPAP